MTHKQVPPLNPSDLDFLFVTVYVFSQILIGAIIEKSPADLDGRLRPGDELLFVDGIPVVGKPHRYVIDLMHGAARNGQVSLVIRRRVQAPGERAGVEVPYYHQVLYMSL